MAPESLPSFPSLSLDQFRSICSSFLGRVHAFQRDPSKLGWLKIQHDEQDGIPILSVSKKLDGAAATELEKQLMDEENSEKDIIGLDDSDGDPEAFLRPPTSSKFGQVEVEYNILLSPTYEVPVLYFFLRGTPIASSNQLEIIYNCLVPSTYMSGLQQVGIMGGISLTNHPISGVPVYFIHPCNTANALKSVSGDTMPTIHTYLLLWLGVVGACVGLHVPKELMLP